MAATKTPVPPMAVSSSPLTVALGRDLDELDLVAGPRRRSATQRDWVVARAERRVPRRRAAHGWARLGRRGHVGDVLGLEVEELAQGCGVVVAAALHGELLDPHGRRVEQLLDDAVHGEADLGPVASSSPGQPLVEPVHLGRDESGGPRAQRGHGRVTDFSMRRVEVVGDLAR